MSDENKEILDQVTDLISDKKKVTNEKNSKEKLKKLESIVSDKNMESLEKNSVDLVIKSELKKWIEKNAEKIAREVIKDQAKKIFK
tara:strand:+ start:315 stop:572 length:258 start_codon:yes stop_codon:yes gene_type:complete